MRDKRLVATPRWRASAATVSQLRQGGPRRSCTSATLVTAFCVLLYRDGSERGAAEALIDLGSQEPIRVFQAPVRVLCQPGAQQEVGNCGAVVVRIELTDLAVHERRHDRHRRR